MTDERHSDPTLRSTVVVPVQPGPLVALSDLDHRRDDIDDVLDDVFGAPDERGPGAVDALLLVGGAGAVVAGVVASLPSVVVVGGAAAVALGAVLPVRSALRHLAVRRRQARLSDRVGHGSLLRTDHPATAALVAAHTALWTAAGGLASAPRARVQTIAADAAHEVASLLAGRAPVTAEEIAYVEARVAALQQLRATLADPRVGDGEAERRRALVQAREEVEQIGGGSSLTDAAELTRDLLGDDG
ncbi:MAG: hypothetical protein Q7V57_18275 [Actinomycetota bacterium]|nr:hypothetical protein [Actinomycetota bacterium]